MLNRLNIKQIISFFAAIFACTLIMVTTQSKKSRGHKYWYIVESRRVNGKPRPVVLAYLGNSDDLLLLDQPEGLQHAGSRFNAYHVEPR